MFGLGDAAVSTGFLLTILSSLLCIIYGIIIWNKPEEEVSEEEIREEKEWAEEEKRIEETM
ncbi:hypothetical protein J7L87_05785 [bacterium]|nr:hypothetical protein [bacterium]